MRYQFLLSMMGIASILLAGCADSEKTKSPPLPSLEPTHIPIPNQIESETSNSFTNSKSTPELIQDLENDLLSQLNKNSPLQVTILTNFSKLITEGSSNNTKFLLTEENSSKTASGFTSLLKQNLLVKLPRSGNRTFDLSPTYSVFTKTDFDGVSDEMKKKLATRLENLETAIATALQDLLALKDSKRYELTAKEQVELISKAINTKAIQSLGLDPIDHLSSKAARDFQRATPAFSPLTINAISYQLSGLNLPYSFIGIISARTSSKHNDTTFIASLNGTHWFLEGRLKNSSILPSYQYCTRIGYDFKRIALSLNYYDLPHVGNIQTASIEYLNTLSNTDPIKVSLGIAANVGYKHLYLTKESHIYNDLSSSIEIEHRNGIKTSMRLSLSPTLFNYCFYVNFEQ